MAFSSLRSAAACCGSVLWFTAMSSAHAEISAEDFILISKGRLPIIISAPHGGTMRLPGVPDRRPRGKNFVTTRDVRTLELAQALAAAITSQLSRAPSVVAARFERKQIDANRPAAEAYDPPGAGGPKIVYDAFHKALRDARAEVTTSFHGGIVLDIHGQGREPDAVFRGTNNGRTVAHLIKQSGQAAVTGPKSIFGGLAAKGYRVVPPLGGREREDQLDGGYIVQTYGNRHGGVIDAVQLEFGARLRATENLDRTASDVAAAVTAFANAYLPLGAAPRYSGFRSY
jgi:N-formylglutamate amidohydrolase